MSTWDPAHYLKFGGDRTRPAFDLAQRIQLESPHRIIDVGCGPGNSTQVLKQRWPESEIIGMDSSITMIDAAKKAYPSQSWQLEDAWDWQPSKKFDLIYSNAALQWLPDHDALMPRLFEATAPGGAFAFQIPSCSFATVRTLIHEVSGEPEWSDQLQACRSALTMESPAFYYDILAPHATKMDIWETEYHHVMDKKESIIDWMASTGLRPFLTALGEHANRDKFLSRLRAKVNQAYESRVDGKVLFPFRRTFVIAYK